jgi:hypothetical protein
VKGTESVPSGGETQVVEALLGLPKVPCCVGAVWTQVMVSGSPSGSLAVIERVSTLPATGADGETEMVAETFGGWFTVTWVTVIWQLAVTDPPCPSVTVTLKVNTVSVATAGAVQTGFRTVRELNDPCGVAGDVWVQA